MLERVWRKGNPLALLVGMLIDTAIMDNRMEVPLKTRNNTRNKPYDPTIPLLSIYLEETITEKDTCTPAFVTVIYNS